MNLKTYQIEAMKTAIYPRPTKPALYPFLGLANEAGEVCGKAGYYDNTRTGQFSNKQQIADDLSDVLWYCAAIADEFSFFLDDTMPILDLPGCEAFQSFFDLSEACGKVLGVLKKAIRDDKWDFGMAVSWELRDKIASEIRDVLMYINVCCKVCDTTIFEIAETNIAKLESRKARGVIGGSGDNR
jgi:NTP pyrophosphatase (non-canonical NTP hydrolase)